MRKLRITIVTFAWPPRNSIGAHRPLSWAKYWSEAGVNVRVLTARKYSYDEPLDLEIPSLPGVEVIEVDYATGSTSFAARVLASPLGSIARRTYRKMRGVRTRIKNPREKWLEATLPLLETLAQDTDVVVSTYDPRSVHQIGARFKQHNPNIVWVADYRDLWSLNHAPDWTVDQRAHERAIEEETVALHADLISSVSEDLARQQGEFVKKPWICITNGFDVDMKEIERALTAKRSACGTPINIVYTGKLYRGYRDPSVLFQVISEMELAGEIGRGDIAVNIYGGQVDGLDEIMGEGNYDHFVHLHGHVTRSEALRAQREADLLLLLESPLPEAHGVLTGKIFEYMSTGVPILSLGSLQDSAIGKVLSSTKTGSCTEDQPEQIRNILQCAIAGHQQPWFTPVLNKIESYSRKAQSSAFLKHIQSLVDNGQM